MRDALARIDRQVLLVAAAKPGTEQHRRATEVLLVLRDSLHVMMETAALLEQVRAAGKSPKETR